MEFLKGALIAGLWGVLVSVVLALLLVLATVVLAGEGTGAFVRGMILMPFVFGVWVVPISVVLGLVYVIIRRAVRLERGRDASVGS